ncbi:MAG: rhomboid family intramembrane serine protease [Polaribacter sp.]|nr:rhomboid family intramembrane serine protease [Polaribacter sp.]
MKNSQHLTFTRNVFLVPLLVVFLIWLVYWVEIQFSVNFTNYGILPKKISGFKGVFLAPFIHSDTNHLFNNSIPLLILIAGLVYFYRDVFFKVLVYGTLLSGVCTWIIAREAYHIGASGVVYLLFSFVFFSGIIKRHFQLVAVSLIVIFLYGSMIWYVFPVKEGVSWEGHLSGFVVGLFFAFFYRKKGIVKTQYQFKQTDFDLLFDEDGNFIEPKNPIEKEME